VDHLVLPAYNEAESLGSLLERVRAVAAGHPLAVLVVDDGSQDATAQVARRFAPRIPIEVLAHPRNLGLGAALRTGIEAALSRTAAGDAIVVMDADDTHPPDSIPEMVSRLGAGFDVVIASRFVPGATSSGLSRARSLLSLGAAALARRLLRAPGVTDFTCGYRAYRHEVLAAARQDWGDRLIEEPGFACMLELLTKLADRGARFAEVPLRLGYDRKRGASKMRVFRTVRASLGVLWRARRRRSG